MSFIEAKLAEHGATAKVLPPGHVVAAHAQEFYRALAEKLVERRILEMLDVPKLVAQVIGQLEPVDFGDLREKIGRVLAANPPESWRTLVEAEVRKAVHERLATVNWRALLD